MSFQQWLQQQNWELIFTAVTLLTMIIGLISERNEGFTTATIIWYSIAYVAGGTYGLKASIESLRERTIDIDLLMILAAVGAAIVGEPFEGSMLLFLFSHTLGLLPINGYVMITDNVWENLRHIILPAATLGFTHAAILTRLVRASMLEVLRLDYVTTARAKGVRERLVILKHALRNALIPTVTVIGLQIGFLIGGAIVVENVFTVPGLGQFGIDAISGRDYPQVQAFILVTALVFVFSNLTVDILYAVLDPRISYEKKATP